MVSHQNTDKALFVNTVKLYDFHGAEHKHLMLDMDDI